jgi:protocatechuate 3,4-dioxygenase beta subunit
VVSDSTALAASVEIVDGVNAGQKTSTDDSGRYQFPGLAPGTLVVRASAAGYAAQTASLTLDSDKTADFTLAKVVTPTTTTRGAVTGVVTNDTTGQPLPGARVEITEGRDHGRSAAGTHHGRGDGIRLSPALAHRDRR